MAYATSNVRGRATKEIAMPLAPDLTDINIPPAEHKLTARGWRARLERVFEQVLWTGRLAVLVAVASSLLVALAMFYIGTVDVVRVVAPLLDYAHAVPVAEEHEALRTMIVGHIVEIVDSYLLATILLIFAFGLYELFISRIDVAERHEMAPRILMIRTLDDLKDRLAKVVLLILVVKFFERALQMKFETPEHLVALSLGMLLIAGAIHLSHKKEEH